MVSGGNIDVNLISRIIDRGLVQSGRLLRLRVTLPDAPGHLASLLATLAEQQANVLRLLTDGAAARQTIGEVMVEIVLETRGFSHVEAIGRALDRGSYRWQ